MMEARNKINTAFAIGGRIQVQRPPTEKEATINIKRAIRHACKYLLIFSYYPIGRAKKKKTYTCLFCMVPPQDASLTKRTGGMA